MGWDFRKQDRLAPGAESGRRPAGCVRAIQAVDLLWRSSPRERGNVRTCSGSAADSQARERRHAAGLGRHMSSSQARIHGAMIIDPGEKQMENLTNKWALVTGASSGFGVQFAKLLAECKANLVLVA